MKPNSDSEKDPHRAYSRWRDIKRRPSRSIKLHDLTIGGDAPIAVQSMTNTPTTDVKQTLEQIAKIRDAGADLVRVSCPDEESTKALKSIVKQAKIPVVADIHFHYKRAIEAAYSGAACLRFNPGNIGDTARVKEVVKAAKEQGAAIRIGVNAGSLERRLLEKYGEPCPEAMVESALNQANLLQELDFDNFKISVKASNTLMAIGAYRQLAAVCDHPLHIGITEAGSMLPGTVKSAIGLGSLLMEGIGDTLRVSLSAEPHEEIKVGFLILKSLGIRSRGVTIVSCPSCARQQFDVIRVVEQLEDRLSHIRESLIVSVIGCVVNGPGEARQANIGLTGGGNNTHQLYLSGLPYERLKDANVVDELAELVEKYLAEQKQSKKQTENLAEQEKVVDSIE